MSSNAGRDSITTPQPAACAAWAILLWVAMALACDQSAGCGKWAKASELLNSQIEPSLWLAAMRCNCAAVKCGARRS